MTAEKDSTLTVVARSASASTGNLSRKLEMNSLEALNEELEALDLSSPTPSKATSPENMLAPKSVVGLHFPSASMSSTTSSCSSGKVFSDVSSSSSAINRHHLRPESAFDRTATVEPSVALRPRAVSVCIPPSGTCNNSTSTLASTSTAGSQAPAKQHRHHRTFSLRRAKEFVTKRLSIHRRRRSSSPPTICSQCGKRKVRCRCASEVASAVKDDNASFQTASAAMFADLPLEAVQEQFRPLVVRIREQMETEDSADAAANIATAAQREGEYDKAIVFYELAMEKPLKKHNYVPYELALLYYLRNREGERAKCFPLMQLASSLGHAESTLYVADAYVHGREGCRRDIFRGIQYYHLAADRGLAPAMFTLGKLYLTGVTGHLEANPTIAFEYARRAARLHYRPACRLLELMVQKGIVRNARPFSSFSSFTTR
ncbi:chitin synthase regulatory factor Chr1 [Schizosaccharomyces japonicus yFS275]|uniref:Chitin synthase regulatory factor Chr1 n=1 Tax=Schizosaccharomyces japonicus (strain yFS275 / FY16936) TaxID=402676 RepID=B6K1C0_SCHJY|nr:chitin synthase regulatory factor Chr1 [Schizosaccharomyces japonicus yFS275]EEB07741.1 chitin synthase regulatory factor Chr1 [Schizosaccharomyces japonicus yFS275]